jgi:hypothetical protein
MDILANYSIKLTQEQITAILTEEAEKQSGRKVTKVTWNIQGANYGDRPFDVGTPASAKVTIELGTAPYRPYDGGPG